MPRMAEEVHNGIERCAHCGSDVSLLANPSRVVLIDMWDARAVRSFALGDDSGDRCPACGGVLRSRPTFLVWDSHDPFSGVDILLGSYANGYDLDVLVASALKSQPPAIRACASYDQLRRTFVTRTRDVLEVLNGFFWADPKDRIDWMLANWNKIDARSLIVIPLVLTGRLPGAGVIIVTSDSNLEDDEARDYVKGELTKLGSYLLLTLASQVLTDARLTLGGELLRVVAPAVYESDVQRVITQAVTETTRSMDPVQRYVHFAVHAVMCMFAEAEDPLADAWAEHYLAFEIYHASNPGLDRFSLPPAMAGATLRYESVWDCLARRINDRETQWQVIEEVLASAGQGDVLNQFVAFVQSSGRLDHADPVAMANVLRKYPLEDSHDGYVWVTLGYFQQLMHDGSSDQAEQLLDLILGDERLDDATRWSVIARFGQACKEANLPGSFLARVGDTPSEAEAALDNGFVRLSLGVERSNALRLEGRYRDALDALEAVNGLQEGTDNQRFQRNKAMLLRDCGEPDRSIEILEAMLPTAIGSSRLDVLESLIVSHQYLGHRAAVERYLDEATKLATGPMADRAARLIAGQLNVEVARGSSESLRAIEVFDPGDSIDALLAISGAWAIIIRRDLEYDPESLNKVTRKLAAYIGAEAGSKSSQMLACRSLAIIWEELRLDDAASVWEREVSLRQMSDSPDPLPLVALARHLLIAGDEYAAERLLLEVPEAMARVYGGIAHAGLAIDATGLLKEYLESLASCVVEVDAAAGTRRLVAELQRDGAGRGQMVNQSIGDQRERVALAGGLGDGALRVLAPHSGRVHVIEWFTVDEGYFGQRTTIDAHGTASLIELVAPKFNLWSIGERIRGRLDGWHARRHGDPFDDSTWLALEDWFKQSLTDAETGDHVVVIDSPEHAGIPWHAVRGCPWTTSYAPGWSSLLTLRSVRPAELSSVGIVVVPAEEDTDEVVQALRDASEAIAALASNAGRSVATCIGVEANSVTVAALLERVDIAVILCHGYAAPDEQEVALMLAYGNALPTTHAVAAGSAARRPHRWSWRNAVSLEGAPALIISAACSSGTSHLAGLGERLGLYGSLRMRGTQSIVAPLWDVTADDAADFVSACLRAYLGEEQPLGHAMSAASTTLLEAGVPTWRRNCFALEGDWR